MLRVCGGHYRQHALSRAWQLGLPGLIQAVARLLLPPFCEGCGKRLGHSGALLFCTSCREQLVLAEEPMCPVCGRFYLGAAHGNHLCGRCLSGTRSFDEARSVLLYREPLSTALHAFKYHGRTTGLRSFGLLLQDSRILRGWSASDLILPVPLHPRRLRERGFNQALLLARAFFPDDRKKIDSSVLVRQRWTAPQASLHGPDRRRNVRGSFAVPKPAAVAGRRVLLVDDVFTTGATVEECSRVLKRAGAGKVLVLTLARVRE